MIREGDKFIIEVEEEYVSVHEDTRPTRLYRIKGVQSLVLTEEDIRNLESIESYNFKMLAEILGHYTEKDK